MEPRRRKYVSKACQQCRHRRVKCDGKQPACSPCRDRLESCEYSASADHRKPASKAYVQLLRNRIELLEQILRSKSIEVDEIMGKATVASHTAHCSTNGPHGSIESRTDTSTFEQLCAVLEGALSLDESMTFEQDGDVRYFGLTSGRLEFRQAIGADGSDGSPITTIDDEKFLKSRVDRNELLLGLEHDQVDSDLQAHLIDLYFTWQNPWNPIVDEDLFRQSETLHDRYSSPLLLNCILAAGSRYSDRTEVRSDSQDPTSAGRLFMEKAETFLHFELKRPNLTTIQALSIMVSIYVGNGAESTAWLHQGMAIRVALDLGLNYDVTALSGSHLISRKEADLRRRMYWCLYCDDKLHALYTGRVCTMLDIQAAVKLPNENLSQQEEIDCSKNVQLSLQCALSRLSQILEKMILAFYVPKPQYRSMQQEPFFDTYLFELQDWAHNLPSELKIEVIGEKKAAIPQVYTLHMVYHMTLILLGKAFLSIKTGPFVDLPHHTRQKARDTCHQAAQNVCMVARKYRAIFGSFKRSPLSATQCIHSAALVLIQIERARRLHPDLHNVTESVNLCLNSLMELSFAWSPAERICQNLSLLRQSDVCRRQATQSPVEDQSASSPSATSTVVVGKPTGSYRRPSCDQEAFEVLEPFLAPKNGAMSSDIHNQGQLVCDLGADLFSDGVMDFSLFMDEDFSLT